MGEYHAPGHFRYPAVQLPIDEVSDSTEGVPERDTGCEHVADAERHQNAANEVHRS